MSFAGSSTVREAYITLIDLAVVLQMISYLYVYAALARAAFGRDAQPNRRRFWIRFAALSGLCTTGIGMLVAFIPSHQVDSVWRFEIKMVLTCAAFLGLAAALFAYYSRQRISLKSLAAEI
ncbi:MAG: hypothetical protein JO319_01085 [Acidobacteriaceae bacterium]|nr:hypothetical protein [Acidobacteriaceae bacterium]